MVKYLVKVYLCRLTNKPNRDYPNVCQTIVSRRSPNAKFSSNLTGPFSNFESAICDVGQLTNPVCDYPNVCQTIVSKRSLNAKFCSNITCPFSNFESVISDVGRRTNPIVIIPKCVRLSSLDVV
jgi:hypothetical protein